jgi:hypothetical protein
MSLTNEKIDKKNETKSKLGSNDAKNYLALSCAED